VKLRNGGYPHVRPDQECWSGSQPHSRVEFSEKCPKKVRKKSGQSHHCILVSKYFKKCSLFFIHFSVGGLGDWSLHFCAMHYPILDTGIFTRRNHKSITAGARYNPIAHKLVQDATRRDGGRFQLQVEGGALMRVVSRAFPSSCTYILVRRLDYNNYEM